MSSGSQLEEEGAGRVKFFGWAFVRFGFLFCVTLVGVVVV